MGFKQLIKSFQDYGLIKEGYITTEAEKELPKLDNDLPQNLASPLTSTRSGQKQKDNKNELVTPKEQGEINKDKITSPFDGDDKSAIKSSINVLKHLVSPLKTQDNFADITGELIAVLKKFADKIDGVDESEDSEDSEESSEETEKEIDNESEKDADEEIKDKEDGEENDTMPDDLEDEKPKED